MKKFIIRPGFFALVVGTTVFGIYGLTGKHKFELSEWLWAVFIFYIAWWIGEAINKQRPTVYVDRNKNVVGYRDPVLGINRGDTK